MSYKRAAFFLMIMLIPRMQLAFKLSNDHLRINLIEIENATKNYEGDLNQRVKKVGQEKLMRNDGALYLIGVGLGNVAVSWIRPFTNAMGHIFGGLGSSLVEATNNPAAGFYGDVPQTSYEVSEEPSSESPLLPHYSESLNDEKVAVVTENAKDDFMDIYQHHAPNDKF